MIEVIEEKEDWDRYISNFEVSDFYHTYDYHHIAKGNSKPQLLIYGNGQTLVGMPLLIRKISGTEFFDATSVYGYPGPLYKNLSSDFDVAQFSKELLEFFRERNIVTVFSRLNPFMKQQHVVLQGLGELEKKRVIVGIDLKKDVSQQRTEFRRRLKGQLNMARRHCSVKVADNDTEYQEFLNIYYETMERLNARPMYYFNDQYFKTLAKSDSFETQTLLAIHNDTGQTIGASMFIYKDSVVHYHLSGSKAEFKNLMPTKLLIDEMRIRATHMGLKYLNLGGGLSGDNDSLFQFKLSYSKNLLEFFVWKLIVKPDVYHYLVKRHGNVMDTDYFPMYRLEET